MRAYGRPLGVPLHIRIILLHTIIPLHIGGILRHLIASLRILAVLRHLIVSMHIRGVLLHPIVPLGITAVWRHIEIPLHMRRPPAVLSKGRPPCPLLCPAYMAVNGSFIQFSPAV